MNTIVFQHPCRLSFGLGCLAPSADEVSGRRRLFVVTSEFILTHVKKAAASWSAGGAEVSTCVEVNRERPREVTAADAEAIHRATF